VNTVLVNSSSNNDLLLLPSTPIPAPLIEGNDAIEQRAVLHASPRLLISQVYLLSPSPVDSPKTDCRSVYRSFPGPGMKPAFCAQVVPTSLKQIGVAGDHQSLKYEQLTRYPHGIDYSQYESSLPTNFLRQGTNKISLRIPTEAVPLTAASSISTSPLHPTLTIDRRNCSADRLAL